jgi:four helix bundle protein
MEKPHKRLVAWQKCMELVVLIYKITKDFPKEETYGLVSQMRRASVSAPSNIAEVAADRSKEQFRNFFEYRNRLVERIKYATGNRFSDWIFE